MKEEQQFGVVEKKMLSLVEGGSQEDYEALEQLLEEKEIQKPALNQALFALCNFYKTKGYHLDMLNLLVRKKADVNWRGASGVTPLMVCAKKGSSDLLESLLKIDKVKVDSQDHHDKTALMHAIESDNGENPNIVCSLLQVKPSLVNLADNKKRTPLLVAVEKGQLETVRVLLDNFADAKAKNSNGEDLITIASKRNLYKIKEMLESYMGNSPSKNSPEKKDSFSPKNSKRENASEKQDNDDNLSVQANGSDKLVNELNESCSIDTDKYKSSPNHPMGKYQGGHGPFKPFMQGQQFAQFPKGVQKGMPEGPMQMPLPPQQQMPMPGQDWKNKKSNAIMDGVDYPKPDPPRQPDFKDGGQMQPENLYYNQQAYPQQQRPQKGGKQRNTGQTLLNELVPNSAVAPPGMRPDKFGRYPQMPPFDPRQMMHGPPVAPEFMLDKSHKIPPPADSFMRPMYMMDNAHGAKSPQNFHPEESNLGFTAVQPPMQNPKKRPPPQNYPGPKEGERYFVPDMQKYPDLEKQLKLLDEQIAQKKKAVDLLAAETDEVKKRTTELQAKYAKEFSDQPKEQVVLDNKCLQCFQFRHEQHYKSISFELFSDILHREIKAYLKWMQIKIEAWWPKAETLINEVNETIKKVYPEAKVSLVGSYFTGKFVPWSNFNFNVVVYNNGGIPLKPEDILETLLPEFKQKGEMLTTIK